MSKGKGKRNADEQVNKEDTGSLSFEDFEDEFEDEFFEEEIIEDGKPITGDAGDDKSDMGDKGEKSNKGKDLKQKAWRAGVDPLEEGEELEFDQSAYHMMHAMAVQYPCLSFSFLHDNLGENRTKYPHTVYVATGTQAEQGERNCLMLMKITKLGKLTDEEEDDKYPDDDDDDDDDDDEDADSDDPVVNMRVIPHDGCVNRIRTLQYKNKLFAAVWSEEGQVGIYDLTGPYLSLDKSFYEDFSDITPMFTNRSHSAEGFALDWSPHNTLRLLSGDNQRAIYETTGAENGTWKTGALPFLGHTGSVEDIQWSPTEENVFSSCSADNTVKIWDARQNVRKAVLSVDAHSSDVNAIAWNKKVAYLLASGSDDKTLKIWDLRNFKPGQSVAHFKYHNDQICSLEWSPHDESQIVAASADNQVTIWDLSLEADEGEVEEDEDIPPQLFFVHQGQQDVKEVHWHPQIPNAVASTAADGFNFFQPSNAE